MKRRQKEGGSSARRKNLGLLAVSARKWLYLTPVLMEETERYAWVVAPPPLWHSPVTALSLNCWVYSWQLEPQRRQEHGAYKLPLHFTAKINSNCRVRA